MGTFSLALQRGKKAANTAEIANLEIDTVFKELKTDVLEATAGKVAIGLGKADGIRAFVYWAQAAAKEASTGMASVESSMRSMHLLASNPKAFDKSSVRLGGFEWPFEGYPCELSYSNHTARCHDERALREALQQMLANAWVANKIVEIEGRELVDSVIGDVDYEL
ncbi:hypothetical protein [Herbaspirillum rubrisubalbicans]|uniref:hypothetical protein n=1 Tax=Herbaspirillum rubrisubalbicans TaxID=80842 RepID=UPI0012F63FD0|nr:hypothetical protein [Herbaspirillum rubrisubalbicans]